MSDISTRVRQLRLERGFSVTELSRRSGIPRPNLSRIERGLVNPRVSTVERLLAALDLELDIVPRRVLDIQGVVDRATRGSRILASCNFGSSDPWRRIGRRAALGEDVSVEARTLAASEPDGR